MTDEPELRFNTLQTVYNGTLSRRWILQVREVLSNR